MNLPVTEDRKTRPSAIERNFNCPASMIPPKIKIEFGGYSNQGNENHEAISQIVDGDFKSENYSKDATISALVVRKFLNEFADLIVVQTEMKVSTIINGVLLKGTLDALIRIDGIITCFDWKTGYKDKDAKRQIMAYVLMVSELPEYKGENMFRGLTFNTKSQNYFVHDISRSDLIEFRGEFLEMLGRGEIYHVEFDNCEWCPRQKECPALAMAKANAVESMTGRQYMGDLLACYDKYKLAKQAIAEYDKLLRIEAKHGIENDQYKAYFKTSEVKSLIAIESINFLNTIYGDAGELRRSMTLTKTKVEEFVKARAGEGKKGKDYLKVLELLEAANAMTIKEKNTLTVDKK